MVQMYDQSALINRIRHNFVLEKPFVNNVSLKSSFWDKIFKHSDEVDIVYAFDVLGALPIEEKAAEYNLKLNFGYVARRDLDAVHKRCESIINKLSSNNLSARTIVIPAYTDAFSRILEKLDLNKYAVVMADGYDVVFDRDIFQGGQPLFADATIIKLHRSSLVKYLDDAKEKDKNRYIHIISSYVYGLHNTPISNIPDFLAKQNIDDRGSIIVTSGDNEIIYNNASDGVAELVLPKGLNFGKYVLTNKIEVKTRGSKLGMFGARWTDYGIWINEKQACTQTNGLNIFTYDLVEQKLIEVGWFYNSTSDGVVVPYDAISNLKI